MIGRNDFAVGGTGDDSLNFVAKSTDVSFPITTTESIISDKRFRENSKIILFSNIYPKM